METSDIIEPFACPKWTSIQNCLEHVDFWTFLEKQNSIYQQNFLNTVSEHFFGNEKFIEQCLNTCGAHTILSIPRKYLTRNILLLFRDKYFSKVPRRLRTYEFFIFLFQTNSDFDTIIYYLSEVPEEMLTNELIEEALREQHGAHRLFLLFQSGFIKFQQITESMTSKIFTTDSMVIEELKEVPLKCRTENVCRSAMLFAYDKRNTNYICRDTFFAYVPTSVLLSPSFQEFSKQIIPPALYLKVFQKPQFVPDMVTEETIVERIITQDNYFYNLLNTHHFLNESILCAELRRSYGLLDILIEKYNFSKKFSDDKMNTFREKEHERDVLYEFIYYMQQRGSDISCPPFEHDHLSSELVEFAFRVCTSSITENFKFYLRCVPEEFRTTELWNRAIKYMEPYRNIRKSICPNYGRFYHEDFSTRQEIPTKYQTDELFFRLYDFHSSFYTLFDKSKLSLESIKRLFRYKHFSVREARELSPAIFELDFIYNQPIIWKQLIDNSCEFISLFPTARLTSKIINYAMERSGITLKYLPEEFRTFENCVAAVRKRKYAINDVPTNLRKKVREFFKRENESTSSK